MSPKGLSLNSSSFKTAFARRFLRSLLRMKKHSPASLSSKEIRRRSRKIKIAAYSSMALAVGSRRAWSRAIIFKLRCRVRHHGLVIRKRYSGVKKKRIIENKPSGELSQADKLRQLVPGGETMDFCNLLEETADYIKCLSTKIKVMQSIADLYST